MRCAPNDNTRHHSDIRQVPNTAVARLTATITALRSIGVAVHGGVATYQRWAPAVARYSFDTYQLYIGPDHNDH